jgi:hypothetical protein
MQMLMPNYLAGIGLHGWYHMEYMWGIRFLQRTLADYRGGGMLPRSLQVLPQGSTWGTQAPS